MQYCLFIAADFGNFFGGLFTQFITKRGISHTESQGSCGGFIWFYHDIVSYWTNSYKFSNNSINRFRDCWIWLFFINRKHNGFPADVVPQSAVASVYGLSSMGSGFGGAIFQSLSGLTEKNL